MSGETRVQSREPEQFRSPLSGSRLPTLRSQLVNDPCGIRTQPNQRERLTTSPEVERAGRKWVVGGQASQCQIACLAIHYPLSTNHYPSGPGGARTLVPESSARCYTISATGPMNATTPRNETARCPVRDTGLLKAAGGQTADVTCAGGTDSVRRSIRYILDRCRAQD